MLGVTGWYAGVRGLLRYFAERPHKNTSLVFKRRCRLALHRICFDRFVFYLESLAFTLRAVPTRSFRLLVSI